MVDAMLQKRCSKHIYIVPDGLRELMSDISREVLRCQPKNTYLFIADYLDALIITRENARVAARLVQSISEITTTTLEILKTTGLSRKEADRMVSTIQKAFRKHLRERPVVCDDEEIDEVDETNIVTNIINEAAISEEIAEQAAAIIQTAYRNYKQKREKEKELLAGMIDWRVAARSAIRLYRRTGVTNEEANRAATLIKAAYKGYYQRKLMRKIKQKETQTEQEAVIEQVSEGEIKSSVRKSDRSVRIKYDTVIPHVDFDEFASESPKSSTKESTVSLVIADTLNDLLERTYSLICQYKINVASLQGHEFNLEDDYEAITQTNAYSSHPIQFFYEEEITEEEGAVDFHFDLEPSETEN